MNDIQTKFNITIKKIKYLFEIEFRNRIELQLIEFYPEFLNNRLESYEIQVEFDILKETDPDLDYIFIEAKKNIDLTYKFFYEYTINEDGKLKTRNLNEIQPPVIHGIDFLFGEKFIIKSFFRFNN